MLKNLKRFFMSIFILFFSFSCFFSTLTCSAASLYDPYTQFHPETSDLSESETSNLSTRLQFFCGITQEDFNKLLELKIPKQSQYYTSICKNLFNLIRSKEDYEEMQSVLKGLAINLEFIVDLDQELFPAYYCERDVLPLYEEAAKKVFGDQYSTIDKEDFKIFDLIFVYSYLLDSVNKGELEKGRYLDYIKQILGRMRLILEDSFNKS